MCGDRHPWCTRRLVSTHGLLFAFSAAISAHNPPVLASGPRPAHVHEPPVAGWWRPDAVIRLFVKATPPNHTPQACEEPRTRPHGLGAACLSRTGLGNKVSRSVQRNGCSFNSAVCSPGLVTVNVTSPGSPVD